MSSHIHESERIGLDYDCVLVALKNGDAMSASDRTRVFFKKGDTFRPSILYRNTAVLEGPDQFIQSPYFVISEYFDWKGKKS